MPLRKKSNGEMKTSVGLNYTTRSGLPNMASFAKLIGCASGFRNFGGIYCAKPIVVIYTLVRLDVVLKLDAHLLGYNTVDFTNLDIWSLTQDSQCLSVVILQAVGQC